ncbi:hypothetical protein B0H16DRAFT_582148 [Mycena metata]|uniref:Uncharacterized protein n=1 Tax=Mycena metata TaxID=1033252 RepID=A0AAD7H543_9AGAR|nr:hypothetical protein B0H16DRAFT_582148 [Mycena metata]
MEVLGACARRCVHFLSFLFPCFRLVGGGRWWASFRPSPASASCAVWTSFGMSLSAGAVLSSSSDRAVRLLTTTLPPPRFDVFRLTHAGTGAFARCSSVSATSSMTRPLVSIHALCPSSLLSFRRTSSAIDPPWHITFVADAPCMLSQFVASGPSAPFHSSFFCFHPALSSRHCLLSKIIYIANTLLTCLQTFLRSPTHRQPIIAAGAPASQLAAPAPWTPQSAPLMPPRTAPTVAPRRRSSSRRMSVCSTCSSRTTSSRTPTRSANCARTQQRSEPCQRCRPHQQKRRLWGTATHPSSCPRRRLRTRRYSSLSSLPHMPPPRRPVYIPSASACPPPAPSPPPSSHRPSPCTPPPLPRRARSSRATPPSSAYLVAPTNGQVHAGTAESIRSLGGPTAGFGARCAGSPVDGDVFVCFARRRHVHIFFIIGSPSRGGRIGGCRSPPISLVRVSALVQVSALIATSATFLRIPIPRFSPLEWHLASRRRARAKLDLDHTRPPSAQALSPSITSFMRTRGRRPRRALVR